MKKIGFIGIGVMGSSMVKNLMRAGFELYVYNRTKEKAQECLDAGARWCGSIAECVANRDAVITIVGFPKDVEQVYFGKGGILECANKGTYLIDMTTTSPTLSERIYVQAEKNGLRALDAPVSGGDKGAKEGTLTIMVGGKKEDFDACLPILSAMGKNIVYQGKAGSGQHTKMVNQIAIAGCMAGLCEAIAYMQEKGLNPEKVFSCISKGAAGSKQIDLYADRIIAEDYAPGFYIKHFIKDMAIAKDEYDGELPILDKVLEMHRQLEKEGLGELGTQGFIKYYKEKHE